MTGLETGRRAHAHWVRALLFCLAVLFTTALPAKTQTLNSNLFNPVRDGFAPTETPLHKTAQATWDVLGDVPGKRQDGTLPAALPAPSRIGAIPTYGMPAASGAALTGYDSLSRGKQVAKAKSANKSSNRSGTKGTLSGASLLSGTGLRGANAALPPLRAGPVPSTPPKLAPPPSLSANIAPVPASLAGVAVGQPPRRHLKIDDDPFGAAGIYYGSFLSKAAIELSGGYDTNPARVAPALGSAFYVVAPELVVTSDWERHSLIADLRGSYTGYGSTFPTDLSASSGAPTTLDRPNVIGKIDGRIDATRDTHINTELRLLIATDNPGSPNIQAGLARYPVYATSGTTLGVDQNFNRLNLAFGGTIDRTSYQWSSLTDGSVSSNDDRDFTQYGGIARMSYEWRPGIKPFVEVEADTRVHDENVDRFGFQRDSNGGYMKAGSTFELSRLITGEAAVGWSTRIYQDLRLGRISGLLTNSSLAWTVTPLTTAKFIATSSIDESPLPGVAGVFTRDYTAEIDHAFRRWLIATARFGYGTSDYEGLGRFDNRYTVSADLAYKLNRIFQIKGQLRHDWLDSNAVGVSTQTTIVTLGVRVQQ